MGHQTVATRFGLGSLLALTLLGTACRPAPHQGGGRHALVRQVAGEAAGGDAVAIDAGLVSRDPVQLDLDLPEGPVTATRVAGIRRGTNDVTWIGRTAGSSRPDVVVSAVDGAVAVHVQQEGNAVLVHSTGGGRGVRSRIPDSEITPENEPVLLADSHTTGLPDQSPGGAPLADAELGTTVDVLIVFNTAVATRYGAANLPALAQNAIDRANRAFADSQTDMQLRLVRVERVADADIAATWTSNIANVVRSTRVAQLRDQYGADLVQAWGSFPSVCGQGYQPVPGQFRAAYGFSVINAVNPSCVNGVGPAHEIGHNLGAGHDRESDRAQFRAGDAFGLVDRQHDFMTVMAYQKRTCPGGSCTQSWLFSNPNVSFRGYPTGRLGTEDNARNLRVNAASVAAYRAPRV